MARTSEAPAPPLLPRPPVLLAPALLAPPPPSPRLLSLPPRWCRGEEEPRRTASMVCLWSADRAAWPDHMEEAEAVSQELAASPSASHLEFGVTPGGCQAASGDSSVFLSAASPLPRLASSTREHVLSRNPASSSHPNSLHPTTSLLPSNFLLPTNSIPPINSLLPFSTEQRPSITSARTPVCRLVFTRKLEEEGEELEDREDLEEGKESDGVFIFDDKKGEARYFASLMEKDDL